MTLDADSKVITYIYSFFNSNSGHPNAEKEET